MSLSEATGSADAMKNSEAAPWAILTLRGDLFAIPALHIQEMLIAPSVASIPHAADWVRGVLNLRGKVLPLIDLRIRLGMESSLDEARRFCELMEQREQDHRDWLAELEASVAERREFTLTTDPHQCRFGKWYATYNPPNLVVKEILRRFDAPHRTIHATAATVRASMEKGDHRGAAEALANARAGALRTLSSLFADLKRQMMECRREIAVVLRSESRPYAVSVDSVEAVERLDTGSGESTKDRTAGEFAYRIGKRTQDGKLVVLLRVDEICRDSRLLPA